MSGRVRMREIARWTGERGSYRTMGKFFSTGIEPLLAPVMTMTLF
ncbi:hypothetical protein [Nostoc sp. DSM 114161]